MTPEHIIGAGVFLSMVAVMFATFPKPDKKIKCGISYEARIVCDKCGTDTMWREIRFADLSKCGVIAHLEETIFCAVFADQVAKQK